MGMFCPRCGKEGSGLCLDCFLEGSPMSLRPMKVSLCACGSYQYRDLWGREPKDFLKDIVERSLMVPEGLKAKVVKVTPEFREKAIDVRVDLRLEYAGAEYEKTLESKINVNKSVCPDCTKVKSHYYEAVLQVRTKKPRPEVFIDPKYVSNVEEVRGGFDIHLTSSPYARTLEGEFREKGFLVKESAKIFGKRDGRDIYRLAVSVKEPPFDVGDVVKYDKMLLLVKRLGRRITCRDMSSGRETTIEAYKLWDAEVVARKSDARDAIVTMVSPSELQVLDLSDNRTYELRNTGKELKQGEDVKILCVENRVYIL